MFASVDLPSAQSLWAALTRFTQASRILRLHTPLDPDTLFAESLHGEEGIGTGFRLQISALSLDASLRLKSLLGQPVLLELVADALGTLRPFHGHVTAAEQCGSNGGMARYKLTIEPWSAFLALGRDSRVFQDKSVIDIIDAVFSHYGGKGRLAPAWRFEVDRALYPVRSLTTQYQESDLAFVQRLMSEEGLFAFFEHEGDAASPAFGSHTMVIADSNDVFQANRQPAARFTQSGATMAVDGVDRWRTESRLLTNAVEMRSWDYRTRDLRAVGASAANDIELASRDIPGAYAYTSREHGERLAERQLQALEANKEVHTGAGTVRGFAPGTTFSLLEHSKFTGEDSRFLIVHVRHLAHNNLQADTASELTRRLGQDPVALLNGEELGHSLHASGKRIGERPVYRNSFEAIAASLPYRAGTVDGHGHLLHPKPRVHGQQTAIVVGPPGAPVHTDRDHRIKVQFHWQRGSASHSRLDHPAPDDHAGAPADDTAGTWVRVATPLAPVAGANWGSHALPRVGQEVLIDFLDGNIDRPVVIGAVYNGQGEKDTQSNAVGSGAGAATANAGAWFPGEGGAHAHPAVLSGLKSQALADSASGTGSYSQLVFDDTAEQARVALQQHAQAHAGTAELNLGHVRHQTDNQRLEPAGFGAELKAEHGVAARAARGLLVTADKGSSSASALEAGPALAQVEQTQALHLSMAETAQKHNAKLDKEAVPDKQAAIAAVARSAAVLASTSDGSGGEGGGAGKAAAFSEAQLQLSAPAGIGAVTPANAMIAAGTTTSIGAGQDVNFNSQAGAYHSVKHGISLFTYGKASSATKPNQETGIRLHAASGKLSSQSQSCTTRMTADQSITVASVTKGVTVAAKEHVLLTAQGAYIKLSGGNIEVHGPGTMAFKASKKELDGPQSATPTLPSMPNPENLKNFLELNYRWDDMQPMVGAPYTVVFDDGTSRSGKLDANGFARLENVPPVGASIMYGEDERDAVPRKKMKPNAVAGAKATSTEEAQSIIEQYLAQEAEHYKSNYFADEIEEMSSAMGDGGTSELEYDFHVDDYLYEDEDSEDARSAERNYRELHEQNDAGDQA